MSLLHDLHLLQQLYIGLSGCLLPIASFGHKLQEAKGPRDVVAFFGNQCEPSP
jgi:hypothetical protein